MSVEEPAKTEASGGDTLEAAAAPRAAAVPSEPVTEPVHEDAKPEARAEPTVAEPEVTADARGTTEAEVAAVDRESSAPPPDGSIEIVPVEPPQTGAETPGIAAVGEARAVSPGRASPKRRGIRLLDDMDADLQ